MQSPLILHADDMADQPRVLHRSADQFDKLAPNQPAHGPCIKCSILLRDVKRKTQNPDILALREYLANNPYRYETLFFVHNPGEKRKPRACYMVEANVLTCTNRKYGHGPLGPNEPCGGDLGADYSFVRRELNFSLALQHDKKFPPVPQYPGHIKYPRSIPPPKNGFGMWAKSPIAIDKRWVRYKIEDSSVCEWWKEDENHSAEEEFPTVPRYPWHIKYPRSIPPPKNGFGMWTKGSIAIDMLWVRHKIEDSSVCEWWEEDEDQEDEDQAD
jgi:hypothetical protein